MLKRSIEKDPTADRGRASAGPQSAERSGPDVHPDEGGFSAEIRAEPRHSSTGWQSWQRGAGRRFERVDDLRSIETEIAQLFARVVSGDGRGRADLLDRRPVSNDRLGESWCCGDAEYGVIRSGLARGTAVAKTKRGD